MAAAKFTHPVHKSASMRAILVACIASLVIVAPAVQAQNMPTPNTCEAPAS